MRLARTFLSVRPAPAPHDLAALDALLVTILDDARRTWPAIEVPENEVVRYVAARLAPEREAADVTRLCTSDLYLACACGRGDPNAHAALDQLLAELRPAIVAVTSDAADDVGQMVRERLLLGAPPKLADYAGTGTLIAWLRVVAVRTALGLRRGQAREVAIGQAMLGASPTYATTDPQLEHLKRTYHAEFQDAFRESLQLLDRRERALLRHRYIYGATVDEIAKIYAVNRATAARWVSKAEDALHATTRKALMQRLRIDRSELDSILRLLQSQLDASLHELLSQSE